MASAAVGGLLVVWGIGKRSPAGVAGAALGAGLLYRGTSGQCGLYRALGVDTAKGSGARLRRDAPEVRRAITIGKSPEELYEFWRDSANLARIAAHFAEVTPGPEGLTHWRLRGPLEQALEWDSRYTEQQPGRRLAWESLPGSTLPNYGEIAFRPGPKGTGTEVTLQMRFEPPIGKVGARIGKVLGQVPRAIAGKSLRRFKSLAETGEIATLEGNPSGRGISDRV